MYYTYLQRKVFWARRKIYIYLYILYIIHPKAEHLEREINDEGTYIHIMYIQDNSSNNDRTATHAQLAALRIYLLFM